MGNNRLLGQMLLDKGKITHDQLETVTHGGHGRGKRIGETLVALGFVTEWDIAECLADQFDFDVVDPSKITPDPFALRTLLPEVAISHKVLMLKCSEDAVECVMSDPIDFPTSDMISQLGKRTLIHLAPASVLVACIKRAYGLETNDSRLTLTSTRRRTPKEPKDRNAILDHLEAYADTCEDLVCVHMLPGSQTEQTETEGGLRR